MGCLKCGETTQENHVFCNTCMEIMQQYPVKPDTAVHLPRRESAPVERKAAPRRDITPKQQVSRLQGIVRWLLITIAILSGLLAFVGILLIQTLR